MRFKKIFISSFIFLFCSIFMTNAKIYQKSVMQVNYDINTTKQHLMSITNSNPVLSKKICEKIILDLGRFYEKYSEAFDDDAMYSNPDFINEQRIWAESYDMMGLSVFTDLITSLYKHDIDEIRVANVYLHYICRKVSLSF